MLEAVTDALLDLALGDERRSLRVDLDTQTQHVDAMAREAVRLRARNAELQAIADKAEAQRSAALRRLSDLAITPGTRSDCETLLREANEALELVRQAAKETGA